MVKRIEPQIIDRFVGTVVSIKKETSSNPEIQNLQYHIEMKPEDESILKDSKTGSFHEWLRIPETSSDVGVTSGSVLDRYLVELELVMPEAKDAETVQGALDLMKDKKIEFVRKKLGKAYGGHPAKEIWTPASLKE